MEQVGIGINVSATGTDSIKNLAQAVHVLGGDLSSLESKAKNQTSAGMGDVSVSGGEKAENGQEVLAGFLGGDASLNKLTEITQKILEAINKTQQESGKPKPKPEPDEKNNLASMLKGLFRKFFPGISGKGSDAVFDALGKQIDGGGAGGSAAILGAIKKIAVPLAVASLAIKSVTSLVTAGFNMSSKYTAGRAQAFSQYASGDIAGAKRSEYESSIGGQLLQSKILGFLTLGITTAINAWKNNELTKDEALEKMFSAYSNFLPELLTARGKGLGNPQDILADAGKNANQYGFNASVGLAVKSALAEYTGAGGGLNQSLYFSRQFGVDATAIAGFYGNATQFGQQNALNYVGGTLESQGVGRGRFREFMDAFSSIFTGALADGVVRSFSDISASMNFLSKGGQTWTGEYGARKLGQMDSVLRGAIGIKSDQDAMLYQAIMRDGEDYWTVAQRMEQGMTPENMKAVAGQLWAETGGNANDIKHKLMSTFGFSATDTVKLYEMLAQGMSTGNFGQASMSWTELSQSSEERTLSTVEQIKTDTALIASSLTGTMPEYYAKQWNSDEYKNEIDDQKRRIKNTEVVDAILSTDELRSILKAKGIDKNEFEIQEMLKELTRDELLESYNYFNPYTGAYETRYDNTKYKEYKKEAKAARDDGVITLEEIPKLIGLIERIANNTETVVVEE